MLWGKRLAMFQHKSRMKSSVEAQIKNPSRFIAFYHCLTIMGRVRRSRAHHARRDTHRGARTRARTKDLDQIQLIDLDPKNRARLEAQPLDFDMPGLAQHYCVECAKYFESDNALKSHWKSKVHKRRCRDLREPAYTIEESERAAGLGREDSRPKSTIVLDA